MAIVTYNFTDLFKFYEILDKKSSYYKYAVLIGNNILNYPCVSDIELNRSLMPYKVYFDGNYDNMVWWINLYLTVEKQTSIFYDPSEEIQRMWVFDTPDHPFEKYLKLNFQ
jgi:hypothetical protein